MEVDKPLFIQIPMEKELSMTRCRSLPATCQQIELVIQQMSNNLKITAKAKMKITRNRVIAKFVPHYKARKIGCASKKGSAEAEGQWIELDEPLPVHLRNPEPLLSCARCLTPRPSSADSNKTLTEDTAVGNGEKRRCTNVACPADCLDCPEFEHDDEPREGAISRLSSMF